MYQGVTEGESLRFNALMQMVPLSHGDVSHFGSVPQGKVFRLFGEWISLWLAFGGVVALSQGY